MGTSSATHYCWPGCGCMEELMKREQPGLRFDTPYEHPPTVQPVPTQIICPCNQVWLGTIPPPPCPFHSNTPYPFSLSPVVELKFNWEAYMQVRELSERPYWEAYGKFLGPTIMGELLRALFWPLLECE